MGMTCPDGCLCRSFRRGDRPRSAKELWAASFFGEIVRTNQLTRPACPTTAAGREHSDGLRIGTRSGDLGVEAEFARPRRSAWAGVRVRFRVSAKDVLIDVTSPGARDHAAGADDAAAAYESRANATLSTSVWCSRRDITVALVFTEGLVSFAPSARSSSLKPRPFYPLCSRRVSTRRSTRGVGHLQVRPLFGVESPILLASRAYLVRVAGCTDRGDGPCGRRSDRLELLNELPSQFKLQGRLKAALVKFSGTPHLGFGSWRWKLTTAHTHARVGDERPPLGHVCFTSPAIDEAKGL